MANATTWDDFKELMREEYYPRDEVRKLENEYYDLKMEGFEIEVYTKRSHELAILCPNLSRPPHRRIELYLKGLAPAVKGYVTAANLNNLPQIIRLAPKITDQECGSEGNFKKDCPQLNQNANNNNGGNRQNNNNARNNNNGNNGGNGARGRAFTIGAGDARNDGNVVTDTFSVNGIIASVADILYKEKIVCVPLLGGESLSVQGHRSGATVNIISSMKAQKCLRKGYPGILALVTDTFSKEKKIEDLPVVREFPDVFPEELPGLPPHRQVEFQIDLTPGAAPIARAPYRLAPGELQELSNQLQELLDRGRVVQWFRTGPNRTKPEPNRNR
ncbi:transcription factor mef2A-like [Helianthus annuus]|uniref:transcription factor mef2A-like n=1 Tax=Helianthus annuus TaxID=4232 RepID=UPI000B90002E|nr:transcription factor mef2A-like [Helianthus annuus]